MGGVIKRGGEKGIPIGLKINVRLRVGVCSGAVVCGSVADEVASHLFLTRLVNESPKKRRINEK